MDISQETAHDMMRTLNKINELAKAAYLSRPGHSEDISTIGIFAEGAYLRAKLEVDSLIKETEPASRDVNSHTEGMEAAAKIAQNKSHYHAALEIRREINDIRNGGNF